MIRMIPVLLTLLFAPALSAQNMNADVDSLAAVLAAADLPADSLRVLTELQYALVYNDPGRAIEYGKTGYGIAQREADTTSLLEVTGLLSNIYRFVPEKFDSSLVVIRWVEDVWNHPPYDTMRQQRGEFLVDMGVAHIFSGQFPEALALMKRAISVYDADSPTLGTVYVNLSGIYEEYQRYDSAMHYKQLSLELERPQGPSSVLASTLSEIGSSYADQERYEEALAAQQESLETLRAAGLPYLTRATSNICRTLVNLERDTAAAYCHRVIKEATEAGALRERGVAAMGLAQYHKGRGMAIDSQLYYLELAADNGVPPLYDGNFIERTLARSEALVGNGRPTAALALLRDAKTIAAERPVVGMSTMGEFYLELAKVEYAAGQSDSAAVYLAKGLELEEKKASLLSDFNLKEATASLEVQEARYELSVEQARRQQEMTANAWRNKLYLLAGLAALILLAIAAYAYYRRSRTSKVIEAQNAQLATALSDREVLLREIHHRVKNNLQVISGLLRKQARTSSSEAVKASLKEGRDRLAAMAMVHQKLYQKESLSQVNLRDFVIELSELLKDSHHDGDRVNFQLKVDDIELDMDRAIPLGLILNELISNAFKYAFADGRSGNLEVTLKAVSPSAFRLVVSDDGPGASIRRAERDESGLGLRLVQGLTRQLEGSYAIGQSSAGGMRVQLDF